MNKILSLFLVIIFIPAHSFAQNSTCELFTPKSSLITGSYSGRVYNGDNLDPVLTTFYINANGQLAGKYVMGEENGIELGELYNFRCEGAYTVLSDWKDKYGSGALRMLFSGNYQIFYGLWGKTTTDTLLPWNGVKK